MKAHALARKLLEMSDVEIVGLHTGQGSGEMQNESLESAFEAQIGYLKQPRTELRVWFSFGEETTEQEARSSGWLTDA